MNYKSIITKTQSAVKQKKISLDCFYFPSEKQMDLNMNQTLSPSLTGKFPERKLIFI